MRTEGSRTLIRKGFTELGARRVVAETMVVNLASRRVLEKAGLHLVRVFHQPWPYRLDGRELGDAEYAVTRAEWEQQNGITAGRPPYVAEREGIVTARPGPAWWRRYWACRTPCGSVP